MVSMFSPTLSSLIMEAARTSETSVNNYFTRQYIPEDNSEFVHVIYSCIHCSIFNISFYQQQEPGSSVGIVSDYGLDDRAIGVLYPTEAKDFSCSLCVQTGSGAHPASCTMGIEGTFPGAKHGRGVTLTTHPHLAPRSRMSRSYISSPPKRYHGV
jgi:hypothetical protein